MPYHIAIGPNEKEAYYQLDLTAQEVRELFVQSYLESQALFVGGVTIDSESVGYFKISYTEEDSAKVIRHLWERYDNYEEKARLGGYGFDFPRPDPMEVFREGKDMTLEFIKRPVDPQRKGKYERPPMQSKENAEVNEVFIVHGHDTASRETVARFIMSLGLKPIILLEQPNEGKTIIEKFERDADVSFAIVLLTLDDEGHPIGQSKEKRYRSRQNVILELGYFMGKLGRDRVCPLYKAGVELPSDIHGLVYVEMDERGAWKMDLIREFRRANLPVTTSEIL